MLDPYPYPDSIYPGPQLRTQATSRAVFSISEDLRNLPYKTLRETHGGKHLIGRRMRETSIQELF
jgi:hypothetical protein